MELLSFSLFNRDRGGDYAIDISRVGILLDISPILDINSAFSNVGLTVGSITNDTPVISADTAYFDFPDSLIVDADQQIEMSLSLTPSNNASFADFRFIVNSDLVEGTILDEGTVIGSLSSVNNSGESFITYGDPISMLENSFLGSLSSYPNPFNPRQGPARIGYYLSTDSNIEIKLFTLLGEMVWSLDVSSGDPHGAQGNHTGDDAILWYGKNNSGYEVNSGVYICLVTNTTNGEEATLKIAVVK